MILAAIGISLTGLLVGLLIGLLIGGLVYAIGVYVFHAPPPVVGLVALVILILCLLAGIGRL